MGACSFVRYRPAPVAPEENAASLERRSFSDEGLRAFLAKGPRAPSAWPVAESGLPDLTLAAFYFSPSLEVARARVAGADAAVVTAGARPNPTIDASLGYSTSPDSPWIGSLGFKLPIETAGKRRHRTTRAERLADARRWALAQEAWTVRAQVRSALLQTWSARRRARALREEADARAEQVRLMEQRLVAGFASRTWDSLRLLFTSSK